MVTGIIAVPAPPLCSTWWIKYICSVRVLSLQHDAKDSASRCRPTSEASQKAPRSLFRRTHINRRTRATARVTRRYSHGVPLLFSIAARPNDRCCLTDAFPWGAMHLSLTAAAFMDSNNIYFNACVCVFYLRSGLTSGSFPVRHVQRL